MIVDKPRIVGILALQGSFAEHADMIRELGYEVRFIRELQDIKDVLFCILPGGESTTLMKLLTKTGLDEFLIEFAQRGMPIFGTCAGMIVLAKLGLIDIEVDRNAYGAQISSFEMPIDFQGKNFVGIFIRAPKVIKMGDAVEVLAKENGTPVLVKQNNVLASSFHPELTKDSRIHEFFVKGL